MVSLYNANYWLNRKREMTKSDMFQKGLEQFVSLNMEARSPSYTTGYLQSMMNAMFLKLPKKEQQYYLEFILFTAMKGSVPTKTQKVVNYYLN